MSRGAIAGVTVAVVVVAIFLFTNRNEPRPILTPEFVANIELRGKWCPRFGTEAKGFTRIFLGSGQTLTIPFSYAPIYGEGDLSDIPVGFRIASESDQSLDLRVVRDDSQGRWKLCAVNGVTWKVTISLEFTARDGTSQRLRYELPKGKTERLLPDSKE